MKCEERPTRVEDERFQPGANLLKRSVPNPECYFSFQSLVIKGACTFHKEGTRRLMIIKSLLYSASNPSSGVACCQTLTPKPPSDVTPTTTICKLQSARSLKGTEGKGPTRARSLESQKSRSRLPACPPDSRGLAGDRERGWAQSGRPLSEASHGQAVTDRAPNEP